MDGEPRLADSHRRLLSLKERFHEKQYRDGYVASHTRTVLAQQMRNFRGERSQQNFAEEIGEQKTMIARLENPAYSGWSLRTMLKIARKLNVAVFVRFVDFPTFLKYTGNLSDSALHPIHYKEQSVDAAIDTQIAFEQIGRLWDLRSEPADIDYGERVNGLPLPLDVHQSRQTPDNNPSVALSAKTVGVNIADRVALTMPGISHIPLHVRQEGAANTSAAIARHIANTTRLTRSL